MIWHTYSFNTINIHEILCQQRKTELVVLDLEKVVKKVR